MDIDTVKSLVRSLLELLKDVDAQLCANMTVLHHSAKPKRKTDPPLKRQVKNLLGDPASMRIFDAKYERVFAGVEKAIADRELLELLARWKPSGKTI